MPAVLELLRARGVLSPLDEHFAGAITRLAGESDERVLLAAALASRYVGQGHVCLDLERLVRDSLVDDAGEVVLLEWPPLAEWLAVLRASPCVAEPDERPLPVPSPQGGGGRSGDRPLVLDERGRLYLQRYFEHQRTLAQGILARARPVDGGDEVPSDLLAALFPPDASGPAQRSLLEPRLPDWQRVAAIAALTRRFCVVSGGPGTGKTYTVVKILALLAEQAIAAGRRPPRIELLAPTGKAAARLRQSIRDRKSGLPLSAAVLAAIPEEAATIHRCLGARPGSRTRFRHDADNPLLVDAVLVDEASMVDLALMSRLVEALPAHARLILLGDKDQLASVEAGAVLGDICNTGGRRQHSPELAARVAEITGDRLPLAGDAEGAPGLADSIVHLTRSYRFSEHGDVATLAQAINEGDAETALQVLGAQGGGAHLVEDSGAANAVLLETAARGFAAYLRETEPAAQLELLEQFRVLCAHRRGPGGVETLNRDIELELGRRGLLDSAGGVVYRKRPLLVTRNDYQLGVFNGDVGVIGDEGSGEAARRVAFFDALEEKAAPRSFPLSRLPAHETVFAMTVHKSQGSEFDHVAIVLPAEMSPVLSRELLYTAVSRARERVTIFASRDILRQAIARRVERASGLRELLWG